MVARFDGDNEDSAYHFRPVQVWQILVGVAARRETITYGTLAGYMGYVVTLGIFATLDVVAEFCQQNDLPMLPVIVVNQETGLPGEGILRHIDEVELNSERERVYAYDWFMVIPPSPDDFAESHQQAG